LDQITETAIEARKIIDEFLQGVSDEKIFRSSFHLRPVTDKVMLVSTLPIAPMRGLKVSLGDLKSKLPELSKILSEKDDNQKLQMLDNMGFGKRKTVSAREEDIQAFLISDMVLNPAKYDGMRFVASELDLREEGDPEKRADVIAYKEDILYDIELKNKRLTETVTQAKTYADHLRNNLHAFSGRLSAFPNCSIGEIRDVKGIALVPWSDNSIGSLEQRGRESGIALWYFDVTGGFKIYTK
ncbi:MAG: hypothetical protein LBS35_00190, partial [Synergistaceae bacterium]|jgi:hypothetical protein|nr:hypothetical protein [Synergistaceae bacterium]